MFISVAESMVIFLPIDQLGCVMAWSTVTSVSFSTGQSRKAPPDAVRMILGGIGGEGEGELQVRAFSAAGRAGAAARLCPACSAQSHLLNRNRNRPQTSPPAPTPIIPRRSLAQPALRQPLHDLEDRRVLAVGRQDLDAVLVGQRQDKGAAGDEGLLVGQADVLAGLGFLWGSEVGGWGVDERVRKRQRGEE